MCTVQTWQNKSPVYETVMDFLYVKYKIMLKDRL